MATAEQAGGRTAGGTADGTAEAPLSAGEARFRLMADTVPQIVWVTDADGRTEFFNQQWTAYTGRAYEPTTAAEVAATAVHPDDAALTLERFDAARRSGGLFEVEHRIRSADGRYRWFLVRAAPYRDPATGAVVRWFGTSVDIDDRRQTEAALRASEEAARGRLAELEAARAEAEAARAAAEGERRWLAAVLEHLPVGVTFAEAPAGRHSTSNPAAVAIWGVFPASPGVAAYSRDFVGYRPGPGAPGSPEEAARRIASHEWPLARALVRGEVVRDELAEIVRPDGARRVVSLSAAPVPGADGGVAGALVTTTDVTAQEATRRALEASRQAAEAAQRAAEDANRAKGEFLAMMSHELRTPLNAIAGYAELIELGIRGPVTEAQREDLARLQRAGRHLQSLINDVLNHTRLEAGRVHYDLQDVLLDAVVADVEAMVAPQLRARGLAFAHDGCAPDTPDRPHRVRADPEKVRQILVNLLTNAIKFTEPGGRVELACDVGAGAGAGPPAVRLRVRDTGRGIAPEHLARVFEPFVQVDAGLTRAHEGVGLGLAISRDLARGMGGDLAAESTPGEGSTFTLTLPAA